jgi:hypothetical protein
MNDQPDFNSTKSVAFYERRENQQVNQWMRPQLMRLGESETVIVCGSLSTLPFWLLALAAP